MLENSKDRSILLYLRKMNMKGMEFALKAYLWSKDNSLIDLAKEFGAKSKQLKEELELLR